MRAFRPRDVRSPLADTTIRFACRGLGRGFPVMMRMATARHCRDFDALCRFPVDRTCFAQRHWLLCC